jgi:predicted 3-demethylubiquinone-9 3-methyltransferase (glyoxalase superfamily)
MALNGGPHFQFTPAVSFLVNCENQAEIDRLWDALLAGGSAMQCGWLTDRYGVSWQIVPRALGEMMQDKDQAKVLRVTKAMLKMVKIDLAELHEAYRGAAAA